MSGIKVFIGSSGEGVQIARLVAGILREHDVEAIGWWEDEAFPTGKTFIESLERLVSDCDAGMFIATPDDILISREDRSWTARGNVLIEYGMFSAVHGRNRVALATAGDLELPSDFDGISHIRLEAVPPPPTADEGRPRIQARDAFRRSNENRLVDWADRAGDYLNKPLGVEEVLKVVCGALSTPQAVEQTNLRAFVFKKVKSKLICTHFWAHRAVREVVGELCFDLDEADSQDVAVVRAATSKGVCAVDIKASPDNLDGMTGEIEDDLCFILAAPILGPDREVWGTVDFDTSSEAGEKILREGLAHNVLFELGKALGVAVNNRQPA